MLRLSKKADYALMAMRHLALKMSGASSISAREIAEQYDIPIELMAKVLQRLVRDRPAGLDAGHARRLHAGPAAGVDQRGRRHPGDRRAIHRDRLLDGEERLRAVRQVQHPRSACGRFASASWQRSAR